MKRAVLFLLTFLFWMPLSHAGSFRTAGERETKKPHGSAATDNTFAIELYRQLALSEGNLFFSPSSIETALSMTMAGAKNRTQQQIADLLHLRQGIMRHHADQAVFGRRLKTIRKKGSAEIVASNSIWPQAGYRLDRKWLDLLKKYYGTTVVSVDYVKETENARLTINNRVERDTKNRIRELLKPGTLSPMTRLALVNAVYFKGTWQEAFDKKASAEKPFHSKPGGRAMKTTMMMQRTLAGYADLGSLQVLELPYQGKELSMIIVLPKNRFGLGELERNMSAERFSAWTGELQERHVDVEIPKFRMTASYRLEHVLAKMGMTDAFDNTADLTGMTESRERLSVGPVVHKGFIDVNEEGSEAAAASAAVVMTVSAKPMRQTAVFRADHPFLFAIRENESGKILFMGRLTNPGNE